MSAQLALRLLLLPPLLAGRPTRRMATGQLAGAVGALRVGAFELRPLGLAREQSELAWLIFYVRATLCFALTGAARPPWPAGWLVIKCAVVILSRLSGRAEL